MKELKKDSFILIRPFMVTELNLKGNSLLLYALIHGITVNEGAFYGSIEYMQTWCNASNRSVLDCLQELTKNGLITKKKSGNTVFYKANIISKCEESSQQSEESSLVGVKKVHSNCEESSHNNIDIDKFKKEYINSSLDKPKSEPPRFETPIQTTKKARSSKRSKTELNEQLISSLSEEERTLSEKCADLMIEYLKPITTTYDPAVNKISWQADFVRRARDKKVSLNTVLMCVQYVHDDTTGFEQPNNQSPEKIFKKLDYLYAKALNKKRYPKNNRQKQTDDALRRGSLDTGNTDYDKSLW